jgi:hypothetical protein
MFIDARGYGCPFLVAEESTLEREEIWIKRK